MTTLVCDVGDGDFSELPDDFTYVLHLAAFMGPGLDFDHAIRVNAEGTGLLLAHCRKAKAALVMSTHSVYRPARRPDARVPRDRPDRRGERRALAHVLDVEDRAGGRRPLLRAVARPAGGDRAHERVVRAERRPAHDAPRRAHGRQRDHDALGPVPVQPHPPRRHQRADRGVARRCQRPGDDRQLGGRRGRERAGVGDATWASSPARTPW